MTTPRYRICYEDALPFIAKAAITKFAPLYLSTDGKVDVATSPAHTPIIGVSLEDKEAGQHVDVVRFCSIAPMKADGVIALGAVVRASLTSGKVSAASALAAPGPIVGIAMEAAGADNDVIGVLIAPELAANLGPFRVMTANGAIAAGRLVKVGAVNNTIEQCNSASPTTNIIGVAVNAAAGASDLVVVALAGSVAPVTSGAAFSRGAFLTSDASGKAIAAAPAAGTNCAMVGSALAAATGADESVNVLVYPGSHQG